MSSITYSPPNSPAVVFESQHGSNPDGTWWITISTYRSGSVWTTAPAPLEGTTDEELAIEIPARLMAYAQAVTGKTPTTISNKES